MKLTKRNISIIFIFFIFLNIFIFFRFFFNYVGKLTSSGGGGGGVQPIPRIIHYIYLGGENWQVHNQYKSPIVNCVKINRNFTFILWTEVNTRLLMKSNLVTDYDRRNMDPKLRLTISRTDVLRYLLMKLFGGVYLDMDTICQKPIDNYLQYNETSCFIGHEPQIQSKIILESEFLAYTAFLACPPNHPFFHRLLNQIDPKTGKSENAPYSSAGPHFLTIQYEKYNMTATTDKVVQLVDNRLIYPNLKRQELLARCAKNQLCPELNKYLKWFDEEGERNAIVFHEWMGLGYEKNTRGFNALKEIPELNMWPKNDNL